MVLNHVLDALSRQGRILVAAGQHADIVVWSLELMGYVRSFSQDQVCVCIMYMGNDLRLKFTCV